MVARYKPQVNPVISSAELVYIIPLGKPGYLALQDPTGAIYLLKENCSFRGARIRPLRNNYLLVLLQNRTIEEVRERVSLSGHKSLEKLFHNCVRNLRIDEATFDTSALF